ncbi:hypothetical protein [uncultured Lamprocystis sp.]|jgi:hypothetical protein|uniref:hypothetical protein n=1 Tax=uncultured Lamprocystis sp. TaxID=543132 RepID=UPI0025D5307D|nr:hypothetical protein [uncultured Lamprocystis sp.]
MSESQWNQQGATLSHKNACREFGFTEDEIFEAVRAGKLQCRQYYAHGNPYLKLFRTEVESLALELRGGKDVEAQRIKHDLQKVDTEIVSLKRRLASLERRKSELLERARQVT